MQRKKATEEDPPVQLASVDQKLKNGDGLSEETPPSNGGLSTVLSVVFSKPRKTTKVSTTACISTTTTEM